MTLRLELHKDHDHRYLEVTATLVPYELPSDVTADGAHIPPLFVTVFRARWGRIGHTGMSKVFSREEADALVAKYRKRGFSEPIEGCRITGPNLQDGDIEWRCKKHGVNAVLRNEVTDGVFRRSDFRCPLEGTKV